MSTTDEIGSSAGEIIVTPLTFDHAERVLEIYQSGLDSGEVGFETVAPGWEVWDAAHLPHHRFVAVAKDAKKVLGFVAVSLVSRRRVYAGVVEHTLCVHPGAREKAVGSALLQALIQSTEDAGIWTIQTGVFPENVSNIALHRSHGFRIVGLRERIARHHGGWRDLLLLERRSAEVT